MHGSFILCLVDRRCEDPMPQGMTGETELLALAGQADRLNSLTRTVGTEHSKMRFEYLIFVIKIAPIPLMLSQFVNLLCTGHALACATVYGLMLQFSVILQIDYSKPIIDFNRLIETTLGK